MRVLVVEDQRDAAQLLAKGLGERGYEVDVVADGNSAVARISSDQYQAVILDVMLPVIDGFAVCRTVREGGVNVPILMLTARDDVESRIKGLDSGADGYVVKPYDFGEMLARLRAAIRRGHRPVAHERLEAGPLAIDTRTQQMFLNGVDLGLTLREFALLEYLAQRMGDVVGRADIAEHVWDDNYNPLSNVIDVCIGRVRRKLARAGAEWMIRTRARDGYQLIDRPESDIR